MPKIKRCCIRCFKDFTVYPCRIKSDRGQYCSKACWNNRGQWIIRPCKGCGSPLKQLKASVECGSENSYCSRKCFKDHTNITRPCIICLKPITTWASRKKIKTCSRKCAGIAIRKRPVVTYNNITYYRNNYGYYVSRPKGKHGVMLHRQVYQDHHNIILEPYYTIHHIDGNKINNNISNLELWSDRHPSGVRFKDIHLYAKNPDHVEEIVNTYGKK